MIKRDQPAILVKNLTKIFKKKKRSSWFWQGGPPKYINAVNKMSFTVNKGEIVAIIGPNGSGKSTLIRILSCLLLPDRGTAKIFGNDVVKDSYAVRDLINRVSVDAAFYKLLSARENLMYSAILYGQNPNQAELRGAALLEKLGLRLDAFDESIENMSRGMQQKVAITRALLTSPTLVLLDEPTTGLDPKSKKTVQEFILDLRDKYNTSILITSHDMSEVEKLADRIIFINKGSILKEDTIPNLRIEYGEELTLDEIFVKLTGIEIKEEEDDTPII